MKTQLGILLIGSVTAMVFAAGMKSGLNSGERVTPFHPKHVTGALAGSEKCFPCTYQQRPQVQIWVNGDDMKNVLGLAKALNTAQNEHKSTEFKGLIVFVADKDKQAAMATHLKEAANKHGLSGLSMALVDPKHEAISAYKINLSPEVKNTVIVYKDWQVSGNMVNLKSDEAGLKALNGAIHTIAH